MFVPDGFVGCTLRLQAPVRSQAAWVEASAPRALVPRSARVSTPEPERQPGGHKRTPQEAGFEAKGAGKSKKV